MDEHILLQGKSANLENDFVDENLQPLSWWIERYNKYSTREANAVLAAARRVAENLHGSQTERKRWLKNNIYYHAPKFFRAFLYLYIAMLCDSAFGWCRGSYISLFARVLVSFSCRRKALRS